MGPITCAAVPRSWLALVRVLRGDSIAMMLLMKVVKCAVIMAGRFQSES